MLYIIDTPPAPENVVSTEAEAPPPAAKKGLKLSYDEYKQMANLMVLYMRKTEEESEGKITISFLSCLFWRKSKAIMNAVAAPL